MADAAPRLISVLGAEDATLARVQPLSPSGLLGRPGTYAGALQTTSATSPEDNLTPAPAPATVASPDAPTALPSGASDSGNNQNAGGDGGVGTGGGEGEGSGGEGEGEGGDGGPGGAAGDP